MVTSRRPLAFLAVDPGTESERVIPILDRFWVGRDCRGIDEDHRLEIEDPTLSRQHFEIRMDIQQDRAYLFDSSTNGTRLNGARIERAVAVPLTPGDRVRAGETEFEFRSDRLRGSGPDIRQTARLMSLTPLVMVAGDVISYSSISQQTEERLLLQSLDVLYGRLRDLLGTHRGTLNNYVGDAFFAIWEVENIPDAVVHALAFAMAAIDVVAALAPTLPIRDPDGQPIRMGWGVSVGQAAVSTLTGTLVSVLGDATNVAFRLSGVAGRTGFGAILATRAVHDAAEAHFVWGQPHEVAVKGRTGTETVFEVNGQAQR